MQIDAASTSPLWSPQLNHSSQRSIYQSLTSTPEHTGKVSTPFPFTTPKTREIPSFLGFSALRPVQDDTCTNVQKRGLTGVYTPGERVARNGVRASGPPRIPEVARIASLSHTLARVAPPRCWPGEWPRVPTSRRAASWATFKRRRSSQSRIHHHGAPGHERQGRPEIGTPSVSGCERRILEPGHGYLRMKRPCRYAPARLMEIQVSDEAQLRRRREA